MGLYIDQGNFSFEQAMNDVIYVDKSALLGHLNRMVNTRRKFVCDATASLWQEPGGSDAVCLLRSVM